MVMKKADAFIQAGKTAVLQNIQGTLQFLQRFPPFNQMENAHLAYLVEQCLLRFYAPGDTIIKPADGPGAVFLRRSRYDDAVSAAQVVDHVLRGHIRQFQHRIHDLWRCGHEDDVRLPKRAGLLCNGRRGQRYSRHECGKRHVSNSH